MPRLSRREATSRSGKKGFEAVNVWLFVRYILSGENSRCYSNWTAHKWAVMHRESEKKDLSMENNILKKVIETSCFCPAFSFKCSEGALIGSVVT